MLALRRHASFSYIADAGLHRMPPRAEAWLGIIVMYSLLPSIAIVLFATAASSQSLEPSLFHIKRSKNLNEVHYRGTTAGCSWDPKQPIHAYWRRIGDGPTRQDELNWIERTQAYGVVIRRASGNTVEFNVVSMPNVVLTATLTNRASSCSAVTRASVNGKSFDLELVYVHATEGLLLPTVNYVTFYGCAGASSIAERVIHSALDTADQQKAEAVERSRTAARALCR